ncbi:uncharacterized protein LOC129916701 [Episyrphus balteatus]|uniref:uncharacterized protein LOC129916701 n=1 Tax=Episyrphus balteatus TaxID=286459 RepID=UPI002486ACF5|nr:uncharacterized protein LOC129916701 [Episyrphus balteatus]
MELSSDNIEELATALTSETSHGNDIFQMKPDLSSIDVDRVISEAQDSLLKTSMEAIRSCDVPCSFNDILDDICKMNNNIEMQQAAANNAISQMPLEPTAFYHMPDLEIQPEDYTSECNFSNQTDFLQPLSQWSEYLPLPPSALSNIQDIPQLAPIPTKPPSPLPEPVAIPEIVPSSESFPTTININPNPEETKLESSLPVTPLQFFNNFQCTIPPAMLNNHTIQQSEIQNNNLQFAQAPEANINFMVLPQQPVEETPFKRVVPQQPPFFDWARVVPRRAFIQPSEIVVLRPLRTRKVMSSRPTFDLASYFDTSSISIPMIRERPRPRTHRRKQKLYTIPGADNLVFEVQLDLDKDSNNNDDQLYPETEIPELDEIFKRKRRTLHTHTRRNPPHQVRIKTPSPPPPPIEEVAQEEIKAKSPSPSKEPEQEESLSDVDSDDAPLTVIKSMKCTNCRKIFKTCRSLTIHSKRCKVVPSSPKKEELVTKMVKQSKPPRKVSVQSCSTKENINTKIKQNGVGRPLTRSQTRNALKRKPTEDIDGGGDAVATKKLSK